MEVNEMQKMNIANQIKTKNHSDIDSVIKILENLEKSFNIKFEKELKQNPLEEEYQICIIDFEGNPIFLFGIMIGKFILTYYIEDYQYRNELYIIIFEILKQSRIFPFFAFSDYERIKLLNIYRYLQVQGYDTSKYNFIEKFPIINLQKSDYESLAEAIYSLNINSSKTTGDSLFRNSKLVIKLFAAKKYWAKISSNLISPF